MPSIRHHLTLGEACLVATRAHLESAFEHVGQKHYHPCWSIAIDHIITKVADAAHELFNVKTCITPPVTPPGIPPCNESTPTGA